MYDYDVMKYDLKKINPVATEIYSIGKSVMGREIYCLKTGRGDKKLVLTGAHHGLEYITSKFLMMYIQEYNKCLMLGSNLLDSQAENIFLNVTLYIIPMVNPDGVDIAVNGIDITNEFHRRLISKVGIHSFRKVWQANGNGVDINHNYDAMWQNVINNPSPTKYGGKYPESEPETKAICDFLRKEKPDVLICFHSQGKEIYYDFDGLAAERAVEVANAMAEAGDYKVCQPKDTATFGGCKDWFIKEFGNMGFTVEMGRGINPLSADLAYELYEENAALVMASINSLINS